MNIINGIIKRAVKVVIYGPEGIGKSTLASQAPNPLFIDVEGGTAQLDIARVEPPSTWESLIAIIKEIASTPDICKTLVIDTADWAEQLCIKYICRKYNQPSIESFGYGKGYVILQEEFKVLLDTLDQVIAADINVILLAHAKMRKQELPDEAGAFDRWELKLSKQVAPMIKEYVDALLFANYKTYVVSTDSNTKKAQGGKRVLYTSHHPCWDAKNRIGLKDEVEMSYANIAKLFQNSLEATPESPKNQLFRLMADAGINEAEVQQIVASNGYYSPDKSVSDYEDKFIADTLLPYWNDVTDIIQKNRQSTTNKVSNENTLNNGKENNYV